MLPVPFAGPPDRYQLGYFFCAAIYFWLRGWFFQRRTRELYPAWDTPTPRWICWLCGEVNPAYGVNPKAQLYQLPQLGMSIVALLGYVLLPTAALFGGMLGGLLLLYWGILYYAFVWHSRREKRGRSDLP